MGKHPYCVKKGLNQNEYSGTYTRSRTLQFNLFQSGSSPDYASTYPVPLSKVRPSFLGVRLKLGVSESVRRKAKIPTSESSACLRWKNRESVESSRPHDLPLPSRRRNALRPTSISETPLSFRPFNTKNLTLSICHNGMPFSSSAFERNLSAPVAPPSRRPLYSLLARRTSSSSPPS